MVAQTIVPELTNIVGARGILVGEDARRSCDPFTHVPNISAAIVRPDSTQELADVVRLCADRNQQIVVHGGLTGVSGGGYTARGDIVISLERMRRIENISTVSRTATVQAGVTIQALHDAAEAQRLYYPVDLGSRGSATVGGTISTNAGGNSVLRWGMTRQQVLGVEAVLPDGTIVDAMNSLVKNNTGYDVKQFFIGSEGTLGIVTRAVLRLVSLPTSRSTALFAFDDFDAVLSLLDHAQRLPSLSAFEVMWNDYYELVSPVAVSRPPLPRIYPYYALIETAGYHPRLDEEAFTEFAEAVYSGGIAKDVVVAQSEQQRSDFWKIREAGETAARLLRPCLAFDISVHLTDMEDYVLRLRAALAQAFSSVALVVFGHLGDNNIHLGVTIGESTMDQAERIEDVVYGLLAPIGGSISAEHGIGTKKKGALRLSRSPEELDLMRRIRTAIDPDRRFNSRVLF
ncbi:MAG: FAD-binding oxidoreductase [Sphingomonadaceae bacterium]